MDLAAVIVVHNKWGEAESEWMLLDLTSLLVVDNVVTGIDLEQWSLVGEVVDEEIFGLDRGSSIGCSKNRVWTFGHLDLDLLIEVVVEAELVL